MSKFKKWFAVGALALSLGTVVAPTVSAYTVVKSYRYDVNKFTGGQSNYHAYQHIDVPNWSRYSWSQRVFISDGWNFNRYQHINHYSAYW